MKEARYIRNSRRIVATLSLAIVLLFVYLWIDSVYGKEWKRYQRNYLSLTERIVDSLGLAKAILPEKGMYEIHLPQFKTNDRCISCHMGFDNALLKDKPHPYRAHPPGFLEQHPVTNFGCTICHGGQGRALTKDDACGRDENIHWPEPVLSQPYIQASCGKCHLSVFSTAKDFPGAEVFLKGQKIFVREGCLGCHKARGAGGLIGPDLTEQGEKTRYEYNFTNIEGEQTVSNWLKEHFVDPEMVSPGSQMLKIDLPEEDLDALASFVMGLSKPDIPLDYFSLEMLKELKGERKDLPGNEIYSFTCSACHGKKGEGKDYNVYAYGAPGVMNQDYLRIVSDHFILFTLLKGRSLKMMASWAGNLSGYTANELDSLTQFVYSHQSSGWEYPFPNPRGGDLESGRDVYSKYCQSCHGENGEGGAGLAINQRDFLRFASDAFILKTLRYGRKNTAMPAWNNLVEEEVRQLFAYIRSWNDGPVNPPPMLLPPANLSQGEIDFHYNCSRCHGVNGEGNTGPAIVNRDFLKAASDNYLFQTIARGRSHTSMFGWSDDLNSQEALSKQDISDIIGYMKEKAGKAPEYIYPGTNPGSHSAGQKIFSANCAECHGDNGEGTTAPGLNSQEFLNAASNGYILATTTIGRTGTQMPAWGYENTDYPMLSDKERQDLVAFIRSWQRLQIGF